MTKIELGLRKLTRSLRPLLGLALIALLLGAGCAAKQKVTFKIGPSPVAIFVDGKKLDPKDDDVVKLRTDRAHIMMAKKPGYKPFQIIIESLPGEKGARLSPDWIEVDLEPIVEHGATIGIELEDSN